MGVIDPDAEYQKRVSVDMRPAHFLILGFPHFLVVSSGDDCRPSRSQFFHISAAKSSYDRPEKGVRLPQPDHLYTYDEYITRSGMLSCMGRVLAPDRSLADEMPSTIISQSGFSDNSRLEAFVAAIAQYLQRNVTQSLRTLERGLDLQRLLPVRINLTISSRCHASNSPNTKSTSLARYQLILAN
ncbi:uncharacterized protein N7459_002455 [Penicillium hispanicum]|uniref:uncharacterized protein n=1 Tax=Penicillium hispanicum TaxID=1080232 RepID=UPI002542312B|nr:uncharacterized protein N7459_002455 [Penicillium hispanicum]KAJ5586690.1 hypothetical protein N7459_002455 [Penicillium hispanicum]